METFLLKKAVDKSLLKYGLTILKGKQVVFINNLSNSNEIDKSIPIKLVIDDNGYSALFSYSKYSKTNKEIYQVRYSENRLIGKVPADIFSSSYPM